jgi:ABC-type sugar transport system ATPase subunit
VSLIAEPTRGVDVGTRVEIHALLDELAWERKALLVVSSELPELLGLCTRILVLRNGRLAGEIPRADFSEAAHMRLMAGVEPATFSIKDASRVDA